MKRFKYDVIKLIEGVRDRPCLWDKTVENYKDRVERKAAWNEIFNILDKRYDEMTPEDKRLTSETVLNKWTNIRDTFVKSLKTKSGRVRKYMLYDQLQFLNKVVPEAEQLGQHHNMSDDGDQFNKHEIANSTYDCSSSKNYEILYEDSNPSASETNDQTLQSQVYEDAVPERPKRKKSKKEIPQPVDTDIDFIEVDTNDPRIMNEDEAFFASLLPTIVKYDEDERLEFRIEVLAVMKRIKDKRKWSSSDIIS